MKHLAKIHGPLISLGLGSSKMAATEILKTNDHFLSGRYLSKTAPYDSNVLDRRCGKLI
jgi:hypothetical protein